MSYPGLPLHRQHLASRWTCIASLLACCVLSHFGTCDAAEPGDIASLRVSPQTVRVDGMNRRQQLIVTGKTLAGREVDVTGRCEFTLSKNDIATVNEAVVRGTTKGKVELRVRLGSHTVRVPVVVGDLSTFPAVHFANDVIPILTKLGCNSGGCHGKQTGQNGFKLSLFGFDEVFDYEALASEARGRRIFPADPESSLLVNKAIGRTAHGGGRRVQEGSAEHELLVEWIRQGMPKGKESDPRVKSIIVEPAERVLSLKGRQQLRITAVFSDGSQRDVTHAASYSSNATVVAEAEPSGLILTGVIPGEAAITINYMGNVGVARVLVPRPQTLASYPKLVENNTIDKLVYAKLRKLDIVPSKLSDDATFFRRLHLDMLGVLPEPSDTRAFLADERIDKRSRVIDRVMKRDEFADFWALKWADVLLVDRQKLGERGAYEFHRWLRKQMATNRPYDEWVRELITATGSSGTNGPVNFYRALRTPEELTRAVSQAFLGIRIDCSQCHHHPFDKWGQDDFYGMAGFFSGLKRKKLPAGREFVHHAGYKPTKHPRTGDVLLPKPLGGNALEDGSEGDPRVDLANWMTQPNNPWFARLPANRLWKHFLGRGLIEPEDDLRSTNPATNEPLMAYLTGQIVSSGYDLEALMRQIANSRVYQLSSVPNATNFDDAQNFSHYTVKRIPAEVLLDAISHVTGSPEKFPGLPAGTRAVQLWDNRLPSYFLKTFGRSERTSPCECGKSNEPTMAQALHLMNAPEVEAKIGDPAGRVAVLVADGKSQAEIVDSLCLTVLGRPANKKDRRIAAGLFNGSPPRRAAEDYLWTLLNSYEFLFIH